MEGERHPNCKMTECAPDCLERAECTEHTQFTFCGMCPEHDRPRHDCGCYQGSEPEEWWPTPIMETESQWDEEDNSVVLGFTDKNGEEVEVQVTPRWVEFNL